MRPWMLLGAAGNGVGALILAHAVARQRPLLALVRQPAAADRLRAQGVQVVEGDACDRQAVAQLCQHAGEQALIISTMGGGDDYLAHRTVIDTAEQCGLRQMIMLTSLGCGDGWVHLSPRAKAAFGQAVRQKSLAEFWLATSALAYVIVRPGGLLNGAATGGAKLYQNAGIAGTCAVTRHHAACAVAAGDHRHGDNQPAPEHRDCTGIEGCAGMEIVPVSAQQQAIHGFVNRADVAHIICQLAETMPLNGQIYSLIQPDLHPVRRDGAGRS